MGKNDIDDIFAKKKPSSSEKSKIKPEKEVKQAPVKKSQPAKTMMPPDDSLFTDLKGSKRRKTTEEGFKIYDDEELRIDPNAGNTDDCPFDCDCCF